MSALALPADSALRLATLLAAVLGLLLFRQAAAAGSVPLILGLSLCGVISLGASWLLYRRHRFALPVYCASWALNIVAYVAIRIRVAHPEPPWSLFLYALGLACLALFIIVRVHKDLAHRALAA